MLCRIQQEAQRRLLDDSSPQWTLQQIQKNLSGQERDYNILMVLDGVVTGPMMDAYAQLLVTEDKWGPLPFQHRTHKSSTNGFRATSRCLCAVEELMVKRSLQYPWEAMLIISRDPDCASRCAEQTVEDFIGPYCMN